MTIASIAIKYHIRMPIFDLIVERGRPGSCIRLYKATPNREAHAICRSPELQPAALGLSSTPPWATTAPMGCRLSVRSEGRVLPGNRSTRRLRQSIGRATATAQGGGGDHAGAPWTVYAAGGAGRGCSYGGGRDQRRQRHGGCRHGQQQEGGQGDGTRTATPQPPTMQARSGSKGIVRPSPVKEPGLQG